MDLINTISVWLLPLLFAITFHEAAHGYVARFLGDHTASQLGRVSLNPIRHIDPFGTVLLPGLLLLAHSPFLFGYAKPVPVNFRALRHPRMGMVLVAAAGPATNIALAIAAALSFHLVAYLPPTAAQWTALNLKNAVVINAVLAVFNLFPLPPLDGGRIAVGLLPECARALAGAARALRHDDPDRVDHRAAAAGNAIRGRSWICFARDHDRNECRHQDHHADHSQHLASRPAGSC